MGGAEGEGEGEGGGEGEGEGGASRAEQSIGCQDCHGSQTRAHNGDCYGSALGKDDCYGSALGKDDIVEAQDKLGIWCAAKVIGIREADEGGNGVRGVRVHFRGWKSKCAAPLALLPSCPLALLPSRSLDRWGRLRSRHSWLLGL